MKTFFKSSVLGATDQALMSAFNLLIGVAFIRWAPKDEYALYTLLMAVVLLGQTIQNALVNSPLVTIHPAHTEGGRRHAVFASAFAVQCGLVVVIALLGAGYLVFNAIGGTSNVSPSTVLAATAASAGIVVREYARGNFYLRHDPLGALSSDTFYVLAAGLAVLVVAMQNSVTATGVLACLGLAGFISGVIATYRQGTRSTLWRDATREGFQEIWVCARWALPSVIISWAYANAFVFVVDFYLGRSAVAELSASRMLLIPLSLVVVGWSSVFRPRSSKLFSEGKFAAIEQLMRRSALAFLGLSVVYGIVLALVLPLLVRYLLGEKYSGLELLILCWLGFFTVTALRTIGTSAMLASKSSFKPLFYYSVAAAIVAIVGVLGASAIHSNYMVILALTTAELGLAAYIWLRGWPRCLPSVTRVTP